MHEKNISKEVPVIKNKKIEIRKINRKKIKQQCEANLRRKINQNSIFKIHNS